MHTEVSSCFMFIQLSYLFQVAIDIQKQLGLRSLKSFKNPCFRENLYYDIVYSELLDDPFTELAEFCLTCLGDDYEKEVPVISLSNTCFRINCILRVRRFTK
jgi:hypothetical protein